MHANYKRDLNHSFLVLEEKAMNSTEYYQMKMLTKNNIEGLLDTSIHVFNGERNFYYDISSKQSVAQMYESKEMSAFDLSLILLGIKRVIEQTERYLLDENYLLVHPEFIYTNIRNQEIYLCMYPCERNDIRNGIRELSEYFLNRVDHEDQQAVTFAYELYRLTRDDNFNFDAIIDELLQSRQEQQDWQGRQDRQKQQERQNWMEETGGEYEKSESGSREIFIDEGYEEETESEKDKLPLKENTESVRTAQKVFAVLLLFAVVYAAYQLIRQYSEFHRFEISGELMVALGLIGFGFAGLVILEIIQRSKSGRKVKISDKGSMDSSLQNYPEPVQNHLAIPNVSKQSYSEKTVGEETTCEETVLLGMVSYEEEKVLIGKIKGRKVEIPLKHFPFIIGKIRDSVNFVLEDASISRIHAKFTEENGRLYLMDLNSTNGTYKNGVPLDVNEKVLVEPEDEIKFGKLIFTYY